MTKYNKRIDEKLIDCVPHDTQRILYPFNTLCKFSRNNSTNYLKLYIFGSRVFSNVQKKTNFRRVDFTRKIYQILLLL